MPRQRSGPKPRTNKDGSRTVWSELIDVGADPETGKRRVRRVSAVTKEECEVLSAQLRLMVAQERERGGSVRTRTEVTFTQAIERTLTRLDRTAGRPGHITQSTAAQYRQRIRTLVEPAVPHLLLRRVDAITTRDVQALYDQLSVTHGAGTIRVLHVVLRAVFTDAAAAGDVPVTPMVGLRLPRITRNPHRVWTLAEARRFRVTMEAMLDVPDQVDPPLTDRDRRHVLLSLALLATGIRIGEACALHWDDITLTGTPAVRIHRTASSDLKAQRIETAPKSRSGRRTIALSASMVALLTRHWDDQARERDRLGRFWQGSTEDGGHVFTRPDGRPLDPGNAGAPLAALCRRAGVTELTPHGIRHTCGTHLAASGSNPKAISLLLGHADVGFTLRLYSHPDSTELRSLAATLNTLSAAPTVVKRGVKKRASQQKVAAIRIRRRGNPAGVDQNGLVMAC